MRTQASWHSFAALVALLLVLSACAPNLMGGAVAGEVRGQLQLTYRAETGRVFQVSQRELLQVPGWNMAASDEGQGYLRIESSSLRARLFAAPLTVTEFISVSINATSDGSASVLIEYTEAGSQIAQSLATVLRRELQ